MWIVECEKNHNSDYLGETAVKVGLERWGSRSFSNWYSGGNRDPLYGLGEAQASVSNGTIQITEKFGDFEFAVAVKVLGGKSSALQVSNKRAEIVSEKTEKSRYCIAVSVATSNESDAPSESALEALERLDMDRVETIKEEHRLWWEAFWQRSFIHLPEDYIENIYYFKRYLLASSSRGMYPALFNSAIFTWNHDVRNWVTPHHWNMQQIYWGILPSGDSDLLLPYLEAYNRIVPQAEKYALTRDTENAILITEPHDYEGNMVGAGMSNMINNYTPASQIAGSFWEYYKFTEDVSFLKEKGYPFMKKASAFYLQKLEWDNEKSEYYLFPCQPYEHERGSEWKNCITDRVMIESLFRNCISSAKILNMDSDHIAKWNHVIENLWEPATVPAHYFIKKEWPDFNPSIEYEDDLLDSKLFAYGCNSDDEIYPDSVEGGDWVFHFSANTAAAFPANLVGLDQKGSLWFKACVNAVKMHPHYRSAITPDPIVAARLGMGDESLKMIGNSIRRLQHFPQGMFYNLDHWFWFSRHADSLKAPEYSAMRDYVYDKRVHYDLRSNDSGFPASPFIQFGLEPLGSIGAAINEMLLQSVEGKIRIFPALPEDWKNEEVAFKLWAEKGFLVSALKNSNGELQTFTIYSKLGNDCMIVNPWKEKEIVIKSSTGKEVKVSKVDNDVYSFETIAEEEYSVSTLEITNEKSTEIFTGLKNDKPKVFKEAMLGRKRNF